ncbi:tRNA ligase [Exophiala dermatitidis]|uniref:tRNA ligase n=2 Tax=Exophiala dermatitidis TaxID=5970 RepID=H6BWK3_EXODN|nr:TRL1 protein [Exophiala dermatitidis NIH/UT8656]KAJ4511317.1 tRNA ligase [Exophiala dermatitidis]EHY56064.1 TRL1 protein [Exophiala dermatitidis NIH/UT8656]KAJ4514059.1 tRNA ligase [Exophiala dermatitidis]KAJ4515458.1 tRNA ligase [Exophiala dermatitidis]KAJ4536484.1 tRNA ligase [Exophiala dermatitidis]
MAAQDPQQVAELCKALEAAKGKGRGGKKGGFSCKKTTFAVEGTKGISVDSWRFQDWDYKRDDLPTYARGLFTTKRSDGTPEIVVRGYDKFFNVDEVPSTKWENIERDTMGPYELSVKENGCIIFMAGLEDGTLLVCSKHSTGARTDIAESHAMVGEKWIKRHLESVGKTTRDLAKALRAMNATAVGELCDDEFEEHVLEYPPDRAGLYLHGINFNLPEFVTLSGPEVHEFADKWGFKKAQYVMIQTIDEVKDFLHKCAETGSWAGRDTEGFVVRCKKRSNYRAYAADWFFKYKFEEPYLMYRQWREATKALIAGKTPKIKKHKKITEEYLLYVRRQLAKDPAIGKAYTQNHGIIKMRDGFLAEKGQKGSDIIAQERAQGDGGAENGDVSNIVLVPIATIGCGKTTVATALVKLFGFGHVQNDNIEGQRGRPQRFADAITQALASHKVVIADRNNHQKRERQQLIDDVSKVIPNARFVALHYVHEPKGQMLDEIRRVTRERVLERGDNHQTIRAGSKSSGEIIEIMEGFLHRFQGCDTSSPPDSDFEEVINLDVCASSLENLETVITHLYNAYPGLLPADMPGEQDMKEAIEYALKHEVKTKHDLSFGKGQTAKNQKQAKPAQNKALEKVLTPEQLIGKLEYFSVSVSTAEINSILSSMFDQASPEEARLYRVLKQSRRIQGEFHVTLIHRASAQEHSDLWQRYTEEYRKAIATADLKDKNTLAPSLGPARVKLERLVWDERIMAFVVRIYPAAGGPVWQSANPITHITVGTARQDIKPVESNELLARWEAGDESGGAIHDKEVPGGVILDGNVKPVFQRGFLGGK